MGSFCTHPLEEIKQKTATYNNYTARKKNLEKRILSHSVNSQFRFYQIENMVQQRDNNLQVYLTKLKLN